MSNVILPIQREVHVIAPIQSAPEARSQDNNLKSQGNYDQPKDDHSRSDRPKIEVSELVEKVKKHVQSFSTKIAFSFDPERKQLVIIVTDTATGKVIRQIPQEEMMDLMDKMEEIAGIIFNGRA
jgi:flagellar protein FlaG